MNRTKRVLLLDLDGYSMISSWNNILVLERYNNGSIHLKLETHSPDIDGAVVQFESDKIETGVDFWDAVLEASSVFSDFGYGELEDQFHRVEKISKKLKRKIESCYATMINDEETTRGETEVDSLKIAGNENEIFDQISHSQVQPTNQPSAGDDPATKIAPSKKVRSDRRAVLIVVTDWPGGTMAFKFGSAMQVSLGVTKEHMNLVQMSPERIFRVETEVSEAEFRKAMSLSDVASGGSVLFIEISKS